MGQRILAWLIIAAVAIIALKLAFGIVFGLLQALVSLAVLAVVAVAVVWAVRHL